MCLRRPQFTCSSPGPKAQPFPTSRPEAAVSRQGGVGGGAVAFKDWVCSGVSGVLPGWSEDPEGVSEKGSSSHKITGLHSGGSRASSRGGEAAFRGNSKEGGRRYRAIPRGRGKG